MPRFLSNLGEPVIPPDTNDEKPRTDRVVNWMNPTGSTTPMLSAEAQAAMDRWEMGPESRAPETQESNKMDIDEVEPADDLLQALKEREEAEGHNRGRPHDPPNFRTSFQENHGYHNGHEAGGPSEVAPYEVPDDSNSHDGFYGGSDLHLGRDMQEHGMNACAYGTPASLGYHSHAALVGTVDPTTNMQRAKRRVQQHKKAVRNKEAYKEASVSTMRQVSLETSGVPAGFASSHQVTSGPTTMGQSGAASSHQVQNSSTSNGRVGLSGPGPGAPIPHPALSRVRMQAQTATNVEEDFPSTTSKLKRKQAKRDAGSEFVQAKKTKGNPRAHPQRNKHAEDISATFSRMDLDHGV